MTGRLAQPMTEPISAGGQRRTARLPRYSPTTLVMDVQRLLREAGITTLVDLGSAGTAINIAAELLRALGVAPADTPQQIT